LGDVWTGELWNTLSDANLVLSTVTGLKAVIGSGRLLGEDALFYSAESMTLISQVRPPWRDAQISADALKWAVSLLVESHDRH
jgi:hypothetical protein